MNINRSISYEANGSVVLTDEIGQILTLPSDDPDFRTKVAAFFPDPIATGEQVGAERDRRICLGFTFNGVVFQTRAQDLDNIAGAAQLATMALLMAGKQAGDLYWHGGVDPFAWIAADNSLVQMDAPTVIAFSKEAAAFKSGLIFKARAIKDRIAGGENITDCTLDLLWG